MRDPVFVRRMGPPSTEMVKQMRARGTAKSGQAVLFSFHSDR
jgi:hypothetical protein